MPILESLLIISLMIFSASISALSLRSLLVDDNAWLRLILLSLRYFPASNAAFLAISISFLAQQKNFSSLFGLELSEYL